MSTLEAPDRDTLARCQRQALIVGVVAAVICVIGALVNPAQFLRAYLVAHQFCLSVALGSLAILMIYYLTGGAWGFLVRRILEAATRTLPLLAVLFVPVALGVYALYPWTDPTFVAADPRMQHKAAYLNVPFWWIRAAVFYVLWIGLAWILNVWSRQQDRAGDAVPGRKFRLLSGPGLAVYGITVTFASVDWLMSLQPHYKSTMWGVQYAVCQLLSAHAFAVLLIGWLATRPPYRDVVSADVLNDLGNLLFTFLIIWAYVTFAEFMLVWMANLPHEVSFFLPRAQGGWRFVAWSLFLVHFAVPFFLLLMRDVKRDYRSLARVAGLILFMQLVFRFWQVMPVAPETPAVAHWIDFVTPPAVCGLWTAYILWQFQRAPLLPPRDESRGEAVRLREAEEARAREEAIPHG